MREITSEKISNVVEKLFQEANIYLPEDIEKKLEKSFEDEIDGIGKNALKTILDNANAARQFEIPICQDTGMAVVFAEIGQDVKISGGLFEDAINTGIKKAYENQMRCSIVKDPLKRINTGDNTPAIIHIKLVQGDKILLTAAPKGFGSENMSSIKMFNPSAEETEIINYISQCVKEAGSKPCPPVIVGVGIGGNFEKAAILAKEALTIPLDEQNPDEYYAELERKTLRKINELGIGPQGFGGKTTALAVKIKTYPTHIAGLPVAVNMGCHVTRHKTAII